MAYCIVDNNDIIQSGSEFVEVVNLNLNTPAHH